MTAWLLGREPDEVYWLDDPDHRRTFIGASDAATILGLNPYASPVALWLEKTGQTEPFAGNDATRFGHLLEPAVAQWFDEEHPTITVVDPGGGTWRHPDREWQACTPDRLLIDPDRGTGVLEIKTASWRTAQAWEDGDAPDMYRVQLAHQLDVLGCEWGVLCCLVDGRRPYIVHQDADPELAAMIAGAEGRFWGHVQLGPTADPPMLVGHAGEADDLAAVWQADPELAVTLDDAALLALDELREVRTELEQLRQLESRLKAHVQAAMRDATEGLDDAGERVVTWKPTTEIDLERLTAEHPDAVAAASPPKFSAAALKETAPALWRDYRRQARRTLRID